MSIRTAHSKSLDGEELASSSDIKRKSVRGGVVTMVSQGAGVLIHFASTVVLARLLGPEEYGVMAMVLAVTAFAGLFRDLGLSSSTIQRDKLTHDQLSTLFWINVAAGAVLTLLVALASPLVAAFYQRPELTKVTLVLSLNFLLGSFGTQQGAFLTRQMRFGRKAVATLSGAVTNLAVSISMALNGFSYWSLVYGSIAGSFVTTLLLNTLSGWRPGLPVKGCGVRSMLRYGANITGFDFVNYFARNLDNILIGRFWGADALGLYSRAYALLMFPINNLRGPLNAVAFPALSRLQKQPEHFRAYFKKVIFILALAGMPVTVFLALASSPLILLMLGPGWEEVGRIFCVLALVGFIQPTTSQLGMVQLSLGLGRRYLWIGVFGACTASLGFLIGIKWGPLGIAWSFAITRYLIMVPVVFWAFHGTPVRPRDFYLTILGPAVCSLGAGLVTWACINQMPAAGAVIEVLRAALVFGACYAGFCVLWALCDSGFRRSLLSMRRIQSAWSKIPTPLPKSAA